jgi:hypothetical protein
MAAAALSDAVRSRSSQAHGIRFMSVSCFEHSLMNGQNTMGVTASQLPPAAMNGMSFRWPRKYASTSADSACAACHEHVLWVEVTPGETG